MGVELPAPVINDASRSLNFTNEAGANGTILLLKNIAGLWLLQECRRAWADEGDPHTYAELIQMAEGAPPAATLIDPDAFTQPGNMPARIVAACRARTKREICRVILESLARRYREVLDGLESLTGRTIRTIHIVGGGSRNALLNQLAATATGRTVIAGPSEATAAGNVLVQAMGAGEIVNAAEAREIVRQSFSIEVFEPR
jgi:rhamnulokinase